MSRWAEAFAALSEGDDTVDTPRHSGEQRSTVSQSVKTVTPPAEPLEPPAPERLPAELAEAEVGRAAIDGQDATIPRAWTEGLARLDPGRPPGDVPPQRWQGFVDAAAWFLASDFATAAAALGWGPHDLFGCDRDRPFARIDQAGLLWLLNGGRLVTLSENTATIETRTGARQTWRRKPVEPGRVLAWELAG
jgi:hypothetical protein